MEKVSLAREYEVANWLREGLNEIVCEDPIRPLAELKSQLGVDTACTLLWIQNQTLRKPHKEGLSLTGLTLSMLACWYCKAVILTGSRSCVSCAQTIAVDDRNALYLACGSFATWIDPHIPATGPAKATFCINLKCVMCRSCSKLALPCETYNCPSCCKGNKYSDISVLPGKNVLDGDSTRQRILEEFGEEIATYESWDQ